MENDRTDNASRLLVVLMTAPDRDQASRIAEMLVNSRLAACVQVLPEIQSVYRWKGEVERNTETLLFAKTTSDKFDELDRAVREIHSYDTPEIVALSVNAASAPYLKWLLES